MVLSKLRNIGWLQFFPVACNLVVFSNIAKYVVASNIATCLVSSIALVACNLVYFYSHGCNDLDIFPWPAILFFFHAWEIGGGFNDFLSWPAIFCFGTWQSSSWWLQWFQFGSVCFHPFAKNLMASMVSSSPYCLQP